jgi:hypothetical protein
VTGSPRLTYAQSSCRLLWVALAVLGFSRARSAEGVSPMQPIAWPPRCTSPRVQDGLKR